MSVGALALLNRMEARLRALQDELQTSRAMALSMSPHVEAVAGEERRRLRLPDLDPPDDVLLLRRGAAQPAAAL